MNEIHSVNINGAYFLLEDKYRVSIFHEILLKFAEEYSENRKNEFPFFSFFTKNFQVLIILKSLLNFIRKNILKKLYTQQ